MTNRKDDCVPEETRDEQAGISYRDAFQPFPRPARSLADEMGRQGILPLRLPRRGSFRRGEIPLPAGRELRVIETGGGADAPRGEEDLADAVRRAMAVRVIYERQGG